MDKTLYSGSVQLDTQSQTSPNLLKSYVFNALNISKKKHILFPYAEFIYNKCNLVVVCCVIV